MKKTTGLVLLILSVVFTTQAQEHQKRKMKEKMTSEQKATLVVKKMALRLDLSDGQQQEIKPLLLAQIEEKQALRKQIKGKQEALSENQRFEKANALLDKKLRFQKEMKSILSDKQFADFKKMQATKEMHKRKRMRAMKRQRIKQHNQEKDD